MHMTIIYKNTISILLCVFYEKFIDYSEAYGFSLFLNAIDFSQLANLLVFCYKCSLNY